MPWFDILSGQKMVRPNCQFDEISQEHEELKLKYLDFIYMVAM